MVQFCYLRLNLGTGTVSCRLVTDGMDGHGLELAQVRPIFSSFDTLQKIAKKLLLLVSADKMWLITSSSLHRCILCMGRGIKK